jgi:hypothetical protein
VFGVFGLSPDVPDQVETDGLANSIRTAAGVTGLPTSLRLLMSTQGTITTLRVERRAEDETTLNVSEGLFASAIGGTGTATKTPQDAQVISLRTSTPGARGRGRMYWPALGATLSATFQTTTPTASSVATDARTWLNAIGAAMNAYWVSVAAAKSAVLSVRSVTDHVCRDVNAIQVGSILDTQRRRRDALPEAYSNVAYP